MTKKTIVVTGSTRGIGRGLAKHFLMHGNNVVITGRSQNAADKAAADLQSHAAGGAKAIGVGCDVGDLAQVEALWAQANAVFGRIDIWINNAGAINTMRPVSELDPDEIVSVPRANLIGTMFCCRTALKGMNAQEPINGVKGALYNFEGFGSDGTTRPGMSIYGSTKYALTYFTKAMIKETKGGQVIVGIMSPGIVITDMVLKGKDDLTPERWAHTKKIYGILGNDVDTVSKWLAEQVLANTTHGAKIAWLTKAGAAGRFLKSLFVKPKPIPELEAA